MFKTLTIAVAAIGFAAVVAAPTFAASASMAKAATNYHTDKRHHRPGYAGPAPTDNQQLSGAWFVPGRGIVGESCDLPTSACPNEERISN
jgi:hypothetical protein